MPRGSADLNPRCHNTPIRPPTPSPAPAPSTPSPPPSRHPLARPQSPNTTEVVKCVTYNNIIDFKPLPNTSRILIWSDFFKWARLLISPVTCDCLLMVAGNSITSRQTGVDNASAPELEMRDESWHAGTRQRQ